ncbi:MAG: hypothetical protein ACKO27_00075 [Ilumatobacteraceae bacterium]
MHDANHPGEHGDEHEDERRSEHALDELVHRVDLDGLVRLVDSLCAQRDWAGVLAARDACRAAVRTGRQLWPVATLAEYRLALWAPAEWSATVLDDESGRFAIGPLSEVAAQGHELAELMPHVHAPHRLGLIAHERALRGEAVPPGTPNPLDIPFEAQDWEPAYSLAEYSNAGLTDPPPNAPSLAGAGIEAWPRGEPVDDELVEAAVRQLLDTWTAASNGRVESSCVEGTAAEAIGALGVPSGRRVALGHDEALRWLAWAGSTGGAHGRRRGAATGRFGTWWLLAALGDLLDEWPPDPNELGAFARRLRWWWWDAAEPSLGWSLQIAVEDPDEQLAWAISARDAR